MGVSVSTLYYHVESKDNLYKLVFQQQFQVEREIISEIVVSAPEDVVQDPAALRELLIRIMDALIDRSIQEPNVVNLWARRWLEKSLGPDEIESFYSIPLYDMIANLLSKAQTLGVIDPVDGKIDLIIHSFTWLHYGFFGFGQLSYQSRVGDPFSAEQVEAFRKYVRAFMENMLRFSERSK